MLSAEHYVSDEYETATRSVGASTPVDFCASRVQFWKSGMGDQCEVPEWAMARCR